MSKEEPELVDDSLTEITLGDIASAADPDKLDESLPVEDAYKQSLDKLYPGLTLTGDGAKRVGDFVKNLRAGGPTGVVLICANENCQFREACPLYAEKKAPQGFPCPLEGMVILYTREELAKIVDIDSEDPVTKRYIRELTHIATIEWRCQMHLAFEFHDILQSVPAAVSADGRVHFKVEANPIIDLLERLSKQRSRLLKELAITEEAKWRREAALGDRKKDSLSRIQAANKAAIQSAQGILPSVIEPPKHVKELDVPTNNSQEK